MADNGAYPDPPAWPAFTLRKNPPERAGGSSESYVVTVRLKKLGGTKLDATYTARSLADYDRLSLDRLYLCKVNHFGMILDIPMD